MIDNLLILYVLNLIGDYPLQGEFLAIMKGKNNYLLFVHCVIWTGVICFGLIYLNIFAVWKLIFLLVGHFIIDYWKSHKADKTNALTKDLWIDQFLHLIQIIFVSL